MPLTVGGGLRSLGDIEAMLKASKGPTRFRLQHLLAIKDPDLIRAASDRFGAQCIVLAIDAKREPGQEPRWRVYTHGGRNPTELDAVEWARRAVALGAGEILLTSMDADGTKAGYDIGLTQRVSDAVEVPVIGERRRRQSRPFCRGPGPGPRQRGPRRFPPSTSAPSRCRR